MPESSGWAYNHALPAAGHGLIAPLFAFGYATAQRLTLTSRERAVGYVGQPYGCSRIMTRLGRKLGNGKGGEPRPWSDFRWERISSAMGL